MKHTINVIGFAVKDMLRMVAFYRDVLVVYHRVGRRRLRQRETEEWWLL